jgi:XTP/dITP diphosphohydrolase
VAPLTDGGTILIATTNLGKINEIRRVLSGLPLRLITLDDVAPIEAPEETGRTFAANAAIKARAYAAAAGLPTVAEDSGLAIDALSGRPGVESARYPGGSYPERFQNLYRELEPFARPWTARFVCSVAFVGDSRPEIDAPLAFAGEGTVEGEITTEPRGEHGFGYDPIFFFPPFNRTLGEVPTDRKLQVAHRGKAFRDFRQWLERTWIPRRIS